MQIVSIGEKKNKKNIIYLSSAEFAQGAARLTFFPVHCDKQEGSV